jgi:serine/threonine protein kinase
MYYKNVVEQELEFPENEWQNVSQNAKDFITALLRKDPEMRLSVPEAICHPWLTDGSIKSQPSVEHSASIGDQLTNFETPKSFNFMKRKTPADILAKIESTHSAVDGRRK